MGGLPDDPTLTGYWAKRRRKAGPEPPLPRSRMRALKAQHGRCAACGGTVLEPDQQPTSPEEWEQWLTVNRKAITETQSGLPDDHGTRRILSIRETCRLKQQPLHDYLVDIHTARLTGQPIPTPLPAAKRAA